MRVCFPLSQFAAAFFLFFGLVAGKEGSEVTQHPKWEVPAGIIFEKDIPYREGHPRWVLNVMYPREKPSAPRPAVLLIHGGGWAMGDHYKFTKMGLSFAEAGYVVVLPTYRLYRDAPFPACLEDVKNAIR